MNSTSTKEKENSKLLELRKNDPEYNPDAFVVYAAALDLNERYLVAGKKNQSYIIVNHNNKQMKLRSGKTVWNSKQAASSALTNHLRGRDQIPGFKNPDKIPWTGEEIRDMMRKRFKGTPEYKKWLIEKGLVTIKQVV